MPLGHFQSLIRLGKPDSGTTKDTSLVINMKNGEQHAGASSAGAMNGYGKSRLKY